MLRTMTIYLILLTCFVFITACSPNDNSNNENNTNIATEQSEDITNTATEVVTEDTDAETTQDPTEEVISTEVVTPESSSDQNMEGESQTQVAANSTPSQTTEEASSTEAITEEPEPNVIFACPDDTYFISVSYALEEGLEDSSSLRALSAGEKWYVVTATLTNQAGEAIEVGAEDVVLIDAEGARYLPEVPDETMSPQLVGSQLAEGDSVLGFARFAVPEAITPLLLEWSPGEDCGMPIQALIP